MIDRDVLYGAAIAYLHNHVQNVKLRSNDACAGLDCIATLDASYLPRIKATLVDIHATIEFSIQDIVGILYGTGHLLTSEVVILIGSRSRQVLE